MKIVVLGAGAWGTALAVNAVRLAGPDREVSLWARDAAQAQEMQAVRENRRYLPGVALPPGLKVDAVPLESVADVAKQRLGQADLVIIGTPMAGLRGVLSALREHRGPVAWLCKGFEAPQGTGQPVGLLGHEIRAHVAP
ncbi:MAG TPA: 2-dehydropantoate 2-reductase N-terminal domain-containing protein, partial [Hydrogenophaga sp.]|nr:2-dehydropantoate 2-reductase N-terminal domain-containing protein [Hydrogenophaga sp.]